MMNCALFGCDSRVRRRLWRPRPQPLPRRPLRRRGRLPLSITRVSRFAFGAPKNTSGGPKEFYKPYFAGCRNVLDIGCGRGEFLELMREMEVPAQGIDLGEESVAQCTEKGLRAEVADLFEYLSPEKTGEFDGIFASQIVEHLDPARLPEMIRLCAASLRRGGVLAIETPNPAMPCHLRDVFLSGPDAYAPCPAHAAGVLYGGGGIGVY